MGSGNNVLFILHGLFGLSDNWGSLGRRYADKYHVVIPDLRNHGQSMHSDVFTYASMLEDIEELFDDLSLSTAKLMGHSMGGKLAMLFALENPQRVEKLVVADISPVVYPPTRHSEILEAMKSVDFDKFSNRSEIEKHLFEKIQNAGIVGLVLKNITRLRDDRFAWKLNLDAISKNIAGIFGFDVSERSVYEKPTLFIRGSLSEFVTEEHFSAIKQHFPNYSLETIENATHWLHAEQPDVFFEISELFLAK
jgi:pimeloyl-ACP methyl ester carboxylesterase